MQMFQYMNEKVWTPHHLNYYLAVTQDDNLPIWNRWPLSWKPWFDLVKFLGCELYA